jgi:hypothetical protein
MEIFLLDNKLKVYVYGPGHTGVDIKLQPRDDGYPTKGAIVNVFVYFD